MGNKGESLKGLRIADYYSSLLHLSGANTPAAFKTLEYEFIGDLGIPVTSETREGNNAVYDGLGNTTSILLSSNNDRVTFNNYIMPAATDDEINYFIAQEFLGGGGWRNNRMILGDVIREAISGNAIEFLEAFYPINSIILTATNDNPTNRIAGTKWVLESGGRFSVGAGGEEKTFSPGYKGFSSGDIAGEYEVKLDSNTLPAHTHDVNVRTLEIGNIIFKNIFCYYFGPTVNPRGLTEELAFSETSDLLPDVSDNPYSYFLGQDEIEAFQNNTLFENQENYRDYLIKKRHKEGYRYNDSDFNPKLASYSLAGWGGSVTGGPGWGGFLQTGIPNTKIFITYSPRPAGVRWNSQGIILEAADYDPRDVDRVHPGVFSSENLIKARNIIIDALGEEEAAIALADVSRLRELDEPVENASLNFYVNEQVKGSTLVRSSNTGTTTSHNNIVPNYGLYVWRRVPLDYVEPEYEVGGNTEVIPQGNIFRGTVTTNKENLKLDDWARDRGWNGLDPAEITINSGVYIFSDDTDIPALTTGEWVNGLTLTNKGFIMGRGGDGGSLAAVRRLNVAPPEGRNDWSGYDGGDAIFVNTDTRVNIINIKGAIAGGGGGGAGSGTGDFGGGGGGAGGGNGGIGAGLNKNETGGKGGAPGQPGSDGGNWKNIATDRISGKRRAFLQGRGGQAGGGGSGGFKAKGNDPHGGGGGGGRILSIISSGGDGGDYGGGDGGSSNRKGETVNSRENVPWGNAAGGGGWGADGGNCLRKRSVSGISGLPIGGRGGKAIISIDNSQYTITGGIIYGTQE